MPSTHILNMPFSTYHPPPTSLTSHSRHRRHDILHFPHSHPHPPHPSLSRSSIYSRPPSKSSYWLASRRSQTSSLWKKWWSDSYLRDLKWSKSDINPSLWKSIFCIICGRRGCSIHSTICPCIVISFRDFYHFATKSLCMYAYLIPLLDRGCLALPELGLARLRHCSTLSSSLLCNATSNVFFNPVSHCL